MDVFMLMAMVDRAIGSAVLLAGREGAFNEQPFKAQFAADRNAVIEALAGMAKEPERLRATLRGIADADWRKWDDGLNTAEEFVRWAQSRAAHALGGGV